LREKAWCYREATRDMLISEIAAMHNGIGMQLPKLSLKPTRA